ncbi:MAG: hypothetical protein OXU68_11130 [Bacteroidota bacterium]|nr:hypothetical protein [Bacteroidota bacterium]
MLTGKAVLRQDYTESRIRIAFRPRDAKFEVTNAAVAKNPEFIPDISILWDEKGRRKRERQFPQHLETARGNLTEYQKDNLAEAIDRLYDLQNYPFKVMELGSSVAEEQVADVFVRINSEGRRSPWESRLYSHCDVGMVGRRSETTGGFCPQFQAPPNRPVPGKPAHGPMADQMLRVVAGLALRRGRLQHVYQMLRGKDLKTGEVSAEIREQQFKALQEAQAVTLNLTNWHEYLNADRRAGYTSRAMISSENNLLFSYLMYLIAHQDHRMDRKSLRETIAQWFFMTSLTGRYTGNFESQVEQDLRQIADAKSGDELAAILTGITNTTLTDDFWTIQLPEQLETSLAYGPVVFAYHASLILLNARPLFSNLPLNQFLEPSSHAPRGVERHHLFPKAYLAGIGIDRPVHRNQIANYAFVEWPDNVKIGAKAPREYFPQLFEQLPPDLQEAARFWHALPEGWEQMDYWEFLQHRRVLIAKVIRVAFRKLCTGHTPLESHWTPHMSETLH